MRTVTFCNVLHVLISWISRVSWPSENKQQQQKLAGKCTFLSIKNSLTLVQSLFNLQFVALQWQTLFRLRYGTWRACGVISGSCVTRAYQILHVKWANDSSMVPSDGCSVTCSALRGLQKQRMKKHWATSPTTTVSRKVCKFYKPKGDQFIYRLKPCIMSDCKIPRSELWWEFHSAVVSKIFSGGQWTLHQQ